MVVGRGKTRIGVSYWGGVTLLVADRRNGGRRRGAGRSVLWSGKAGCGSAWFVVVVGRGSAWFVVVVGRGSAWSVVVEGRDEVCRIGLAWFGSDCRTGSV